MLARSLLIGAFAALAAAQSQVLTFLHVPDPVTDGQPQAITFATNDTTTPVTILLRQGESSHLNTIQVLTTSASDGQFIWTPCTALPDGSDYALEIKQGGQVNYFGPFSVQGQSSSGTCSGLSTAAATSTGAVAPGGSSNATMTGAGSSAGTGTAMHRNTTMSSATLTSMSQPPTNSATTTATHTGSAPAATTSSGASIDYSAGSPLALVLGAIAAIAMG